MLRKFSIKKSRRVTHQFGFTKNYKNLSVLIRVLILVHRTGRRRAETLAVALARVDRFEFRLLSGRNEMCVFFQILNDFFGDNFALETAQRALD